MTSPRAFRIALYEEHLEEIAFLASQAVALRGQPHRGWAELRPFEERLEAHLDALVVGAALALDTGVARAAEADADELFGIVALACRLEAEAPLGVILESAALDDAAKGTMVLRALVVAWPHTWRQRCLRGLARGDPRLAPALAQVAASRGWPTMGGAAEALKRAAPERLAALLRSAARCDEPEVLAIAREHYRSADAALRSAALLAGLRLHDAGAREAVLQQADDPAAIALVGSRGAAQRLLASVQGERTAPAVVAALGQLGELSAVRALLGLLGEGPLAAAAARALHLITGAGLREVALVAEPVDEELMTDAELADYRKAGTVPRRLDGEPFGERVERLSQDQPSWSRWLDEHRAAFTGGLRHRLGRLCTPTVMLQSLADSDAAAVGRDGLADELRTRHGLALPWHADWPVDRQRGALMVGARPAAECSQRVTAGAWFAAGAEARD